MLFLLICIGIVIHIIADFMLQTDLMCNAKQKKWWETNYPQKRYKHDWIFVLFLHSFEWTVCIMVPIVVLALFRIGLTTDLLAVSIIFLIGNTISHMIIDHQKANLLILSLTEDQLLHILQITATYVTFYLALSL